MDLSAGASQTTGLSPSEAPNGFVIGICPLGYTPWDPYDNTPWNGATQFACVSDN
jgi:hypothetical protein